MQSDGFQLVTSKKRNRARPSSRACSNPTQQREACDGPLRAQDIAELERKVLDCKQKLEARDSCFYWSKLQLELRRLVLDYGLAASQRRMSIVCYGLGSVDENLSARYQFALLLLLVDELKSAPGLRLDSVELFDPVFTPLDVHLLSKSYPFQVAESNDRCFRRVGGNGHGDGDGDGEQNQLTMFYMPHCGKALYNNLLYSNWNASSLGSMLILGKPFCRSVSALCRLCE